MPKPPISMPTERQRAAAQRLHWRRWLTLGLPIVLAVTMHDVPAAQAQPAAPLQQAPRQACPAERPDKAAALVTARMCGGEVRIAATMSATSQSFATPTGMVRTEINPAPVRVRRDSKWTPVVLDLSRNSDGSVKPAAHPDGLQLSGQQKGNSLHELAVVGAGTKRVALGWLGPLPEPTLVGEQATYSEVRPGVDLVVKATRTGMETFYLVKNRAAVAQVKTLSVPIVGPNIKSYRRTSGGTVLLDGSGRTVAQSPAPLMWDSRVDASGAPLAMHPVTSAATARKARGTAAAARAVDSAGIDLTMTPDATFLADEATQYPVTIDPAISVGTASWAQVDSGTPNNAFYNWSGDAMVATTDGTSKRRAFFNFNLSGTAAAGEYVDSASLVLSETYASSCTPSQVDLYQTGTATAATTWNAQPTWGVLQSSATVAKGYSSACPAGTVTMNATGVVRPAAATSPYTLTLGVRAPVETDYSYYKRFANNPTLSITVNADPTLTSRATTPSTPCVTGTGRPFVNTLTPTLQTRVSDPEGATVRPHFEWYVAGGALIGSAQPTPAQASGTTFQTTVPAGAFTNNGSYSWRVRASDTKSWSAWSSLCEFTVDTTAPTTAPSVTSTAYPSSGWAGSAGTAGTFTFGASGTSDIAAYVYGLDTDNPTTSVATGTLGGTATASVTPTTDGAHTLTVRARDRAGNLSPATTYAFNVGSGALISPVTGDLSAGKVTVQAQGQSTTTGLSLQWRRSGSSTWTSVPAADVTNAGSAITWPVASSGVVAGISSYPALAWNVAQTVNDAESGTSPLNGPVLVRAVFTGGSGGTSPFVKFTLNLNRATAASEGIGPGEVNLLTGNFTLSQVDTSVDAYGSDLTLPRTYNSRLYNKTDTANMFGPGWASSAIVDAADAPYAALTRTDALAQLTTTKNTTIGFTALTSSTFDSEPGMGHLTLTYASATDTYTLADDAGTSTVFTHLTTAAAGVYQPETITTPGTEQTTSITWQKATVDGVDVYRPTQMLAPKPAGVSCVPLAKGCRALTIAYATGTTATGSTAATWGDYLGRAKQISFTAWDPDLTTPAIRTVVVAQYAYDNAGRLRSVWGPRLDYTDGTGLHHVAYTYDYNSDGVLSTITPPGQQPWQLAYTTVPGDTSKGRLASVTRSALAAGTATSTVVYNMAISGSSAPYNLSAAQTARWGQNAPPVDATAVYPPTQVPDGNQATGTLPSSSDRATIHYMDANGREVNTAQPGGRLAATWYDLHGNITRDLDTANLHRSLDASTTDSAAAEAAIASRQSFISTYNDTGLQILDTFEPEHDVVLSNGSTVRGRRHIRNTYDQNSTSGTHNLVTTTVSSVRYLLNGVDTDVDSRTVTTGYDWTLLVPTSNVVDPGGVNHVTSATFDAATGARTSITRPAGAGSTTTPSTRLTITYRAGTGSGYTECDNRAEWANLPCRFQPGGQPATGAQIPATVTTYDMFNQPRAVTEKTSSATLRTTTTTYDGAARPYEQSTTASGLGTAVPTTRRIYDQATGAHTRTQSIVAGSVTAQVIRAYNSLGQLITYTDADSNSATNTYDISGRIATANDGKATRTYTYENSTEKRGMPTQVVDSQAGTFTATYNNTGSIDTEARPDGITVRHTYDEIDQPNGLEYVTTPTCSDASCTLYFDYADSNIHGEKRSTSSSYSESAYTYDNAGRLTAARQDTATGCAIREYTFDAASNRTQLSTRGPDSTGQCQSSNPAATRNWTYDTADRVTSAGYTYDTLGRTLTVPDDDTAAGAGGVGDVTNAYYTNDLIQSITLGPTAATYNLDVLPSRFRSYNTTTAGVTTNHTNHYANDSDSPAWIAEGTWYTRIIAGLGGMAAMYTGAVGHLEWQITNLHGDVVAICDAGSSGVSATYATDEYGKAPENGPRYGYLGGAQRSADNPGGLITMGVRMYNPTTGRFLSVDPVYGGNSNPYEYCSGDGVNCTDLTGEVNSISGALNKSEIARCQRFKSQCTTYGAVSFWASKNSNMAYPGTSSGKQNAYRHCIWQAMLTWTLGSTNAALWGEAHENGQTDEESNIDRYNNTWGRRVGFHAKQDHKFNIVRARSLICTRCRALVNVGYLDLTGAG